MRAHLLDNGFSIGSWIDHPYAVPEIPRPALMYAGDFRGLDLGVATSSFPHDLLAPPAQAYASVLGALRAPYTGRAGRPPACWWGGVGSTLHTSIGAIATPMRGGYYGAPQPQLVEGYHVAEFVFLLHRRHPEAELQMGDVDFYIELDDGVFGIIDGALIADGEAHALSHSFDVGLLAQPRVKLRAVLPARLKLWRAIHAFALERGLVDDVDFMQALAHARWALPGGVDWEDRPYLPRQRGRPRGRSQTLSEKRALRLEEAWMLLKTNPRVEMRYVRQRLVPTVISREQWNEDIAPITRSKRRRRSEIVHYLQQLHAEALQQA